MADSISIVMKMNDDITGTLKSIASASKSVSKEFEEQQRKARQLGQRYDAFNKQAAETSAEALSVKKAMQDAAAAFKKTGDEADLVRFTNLKSEYDALTESAKAYSKQAKDTMKDMGDVYQTMRKQSDLSPETGTITSVWGSDLASGLQASGFLKEFGSNLTSAAATMFESAVGQPLATIAESSLSGAFSGASAGAIAGPVGALVGGIGGLVTGAISGETQIFEQQDEAFKSYYKSLNETVTQNTEAGLTSGKALAASRETNRLAFINELGGEVQADAFLADVLKTANTTPFLYDDLTGISKTLLSFGYAVDDIIPTLTKVGDAGAAKGLSTSDISTVATYLGRMQSSDKATLEYLNPLSERGFSVFQWIADDLGVSIADVYDKISKSELSGSYVSNLILAQFEKNYSGMMETLSQSTEGLDSTLQGLRENIDAAGGAAYNTLRNEGKAASIDAYGGALGDALSQLSGITGENQAYLENLSEQFSREALSAVLLGENTTVFSPEDAEKLTAMREAYQQASNDYNTSLEQTGEGNRDAALKMQSLKEQAEALATAAYESSDAYQLSMDTQLDQIDAIRENTKSLDAATNAYRIGNAYTKGNGFSAVAVGAVEMDGIGAGTDANGLLYNDATGQWEYYNSHAYGLKYVPYDGYPALLHEGERVMTAAENRSSSGGSVVVRVSGNEFNVRSEDDIDAIARQIVVRVREAQETYGG